MFKIKSLLLLFIFIIITATISAKTTNKPLDLNQVTFISQNQGWILGSTSNHSFILSSLDGGESWEEQYSTSIGLSKIKFLNEQNGWVVGENGTILCTTNGGKTWLTQHSNTKETLNSLYILSNTKLYAVGDNGQLMYTNDGGTNWINKKLNTNLSLKSIEFFDNNTGYIAGIDTFFLSKDGGANWAKISVTGHNKRSIFSINFTSERKGWINTGTVILRTTNGGINWEIVETPQPGYTGGPVFVDDLHGWLTKSGGQHGSVVHAEEEENINSFGYVFSTSDGGVTWKETIHIESLKDHSAWILDMFLLDMMNGWVVGRDGLLMRTTDGGQTWQRSNNSLTKEK